MFIMLMKFVNQIAQEILLDLKQLIVTANGYTRILRTFFRLIQNATLLPYEYNNKSIRLNLF